MSKKVLVVLNTQKSHKDLFEKAANDRCEFIYKDASKVTKSDLDGVSAIVGNVGADLIKGSSLELIQLNSAGVDPYIVPGVLPQGAKLCNAKGAYSLAVGEHMLALTFDLVRHLSLYRDNQNKKVWADHGSITSIEGATVAILGLGDIGGFYGEKMKALGAAKILGVRRSAHGDKPAYCDEQYAFEDIDKVLPQADIVAMVLPGCAATHNLMNDKRFALMKKGAYLINVGRGSAIDQDALLKALQSGTIAGAAIDVCTPEPLPSTSPLWDEPKLIITPHVAGNFFLQETFERIIRIAAFNLAAWLDGKSLKNEIAIDRGY